MHRNDFLHTSCTSYHWRLILSFDYFKEGGAYFQEGGAFFKRVMFFKEGGVYFKEGGVFLRVVFFYKKVVHFSRDRAVLLSRGGAF